MAVLGFYQARRVVPTCRGILGTGRHGAPLQAPISSDRDAIVIWDQHRLSARLGQKPGGSRTQHTQEQGQGQ